MAKGDAELLRELKAIINGLPRRGGDREKLAAIGKMRMLVLEPSANIRPCPRCGHPIDIGPLERGTHVESGYRSPCIVPSLPGSWNHAEREAAERFVDVSTYVDAEPVLERAPQTPA